MRRWQRGNLELQYPAPQSLLIVCRCIIYATNGGCALRTVAVRRERWLCVVNGGCASRAVAVRHERWLCVRHVKSGAHLFHSIMVYRHYFIVATAKYCYLFQNFTLIKCLTFHGGNTDDFQADQM